MLDNESVSKSCRFTKATDIVITITKMGTFLEFQITINPKNTDADWTMEGSITMKAALNDQMNLDEKWVNAKFRANDPPSITIPLHTVNQTKFSFVVHVILKEHCGLMNMGNTCYVNVAIQMLFHCPPFRRMVLSMSNGPLKQLFISINNTKAAIDMSTFLNTFANWPEGHEIFVQNDAMASSSY